LKTKIWTFEVFRLLQHIGFFTSPFYGPVYVTLPTDRGKNIPA